MSMIFIVSTWFATHDHDAISGKYVKEKYNEHDLPIGRM
jgi:hypothetical protein